MSNALSIRAIRLEDLSEVATLLSSSFYPQEHWLGWLHPVLRLGIYQDLYSRLQDQSLTHACLVGLWHTSDSGSATEQLVGTVEVALRSLAWPLPTPSVPYISNLAVMKPYRGKGIGRELLLACERVVRGWGRQDLYLHVMETNGSAQHLYARVGYQLYRNDFSFTSALLGQPRRLLLRKQLVP